jgi:uncharacterized membrane protein YgcG
VGRATPVDPATPVGLVDPVGRVTVVDPGDMNRVVAATVGTAVAMAPVGPVVRVGMILVVRVGMTPEDPEVPVVRVVRVGMILAVPVGMILVDTVGRLRAPNQVVLVDPVGRLRPPNPVVLVDPERLVVPNPVARVEPGNREATDLSLGRALLGRMPMRLHLTAARPVLMPALLHLMPALLHLTPADRRTPVDRRWDPTTRAVAIRAEAARAVATRRAEATDWRSGTISAGRLKACVPADEPRIGNCEFALLTTLFVSPQLVLDTQHGVKNSVRFAAATAVMAAGLGLAGLGVATEAQAQVGPFPQWCPGDFWDPGWGNNWDGGRCHDNWRGGPGDRGGFGDHGGPGGFGDHGGPGDHGGFGGPGDHGGGDHGGGDHGGGGGHR